MITKEMTDPKIERSRERTAPIFAPPPGNGSGSGAGEGMDRKIQKKKWPPKKIALWAGAALFVALVVYGFISTSGESRLNVERDKITIATVQGGEFQELINVTGNVMPRTTVYLDAVEGGRVEEVYVREGATVTEGEPLLRLSNSDLQMRLLNNQAALTEQENYLQNMRFQMEQNRLNLRQQLIQMDYEVQRLQRELDRNRELYEKKLIAQQEFEQLQDEYDYWLERRATTREIYEQDSASQATRLEQMQESISSMRRSFGLLQQSLDNLVVRAPVSGHLTALNAEIGELRGPGSRFGQIDVLDGGYKVRAGIDEYYISRVFRGQTATTQPLGGTEYRLEVTRVYPEVRDGRFEVDLDFVGAEPQNIRRGQTIRFDLELSDPAQAVILPRGGFYQETGGNWIYVVDPSGSYATKRPIRLGRQNPDYYEVLEGLEPGEQVVTSSYQTFGDAGRLVFE